MTEPTEKLLRECPFCNGEAELLDSLFCENMKQIQCKNCGALSASHTEKTVTKLWNRRSEKEVGE